MSDDNLTGFQNACEPLHTELAVIRQSLARLVINYYWIFIALSSLRYFYEIFHNVFRGEQLSLILIVGFSFYPLYILVGALIKSIVKERIPRSFVQLRATGALDESVQRLVPGFVAKLNHPLGDVCGIVFCFCVLAFYFSELSSIADVPLLALLIIDMLLAYAGGVAIWRIGVTVWEFRKLWRQGELKIRPFHPDGCGGLSAIGQLFFSLSFVLIVIGLFLGGWLVYSQSIKAGFPASDGPLGNFGPLFVGSSVAMVAASLLIFFWPLHAVHRLMKAEAAPHEAQVLALAGRIAALEESVLCSAFRPNHEELEARLAELERLRSIYSHERKIPTWPVDLATLGKFVSAQAALWVGPTSVLGLWEKIKPLWPN